MASWPLVTLAALFLEDDYILCLWLFLDRRIDSCVLYLWTADRSVVTSSNQKQIINADLCPDLLIKVLHHYAVVPQHLVLATKQPDNCKYLVWVRRQRYSACWVMHVDYRILRCFWLPVCLTEFSFCTLKLLFEQRYFPLLHSSYILRVLDKVEVHGLYAFLIEVSEEIAE